MSYATFRSGRHGNFGQILSCAFLVAVLVAMAPHSMASSSKSSSSSSAKPAAPAPKPAAPANTGARPPAGNTGGYHPPGSNGNGYTHPPSANGTHPPSVNGTHPPSVNNTHPPSVNNTQHPPSGSGGNRPPSVNNTQRPPTVNNTQHPPSNTPAPHTNNPTNASNNHTPPVGNQPQGKTINTSTGKVYRSPDNKQQFQYDKSGRPTVTQVQRPDGSTQVTQRLPGGNRVVQTARFVPNVGVVRTTSYGPGRGMVERPVFGHPCCVRRSYLVGNHSYAVVYRGYQYRGIVYYRPVPAYVYSPAFYAWTVQPWGPGVAFGWGWAGQPWFGIYGGVFTPYPVYGGFDQWATDYMISTNLQQAYDAGRADEANDASAAPPPQITPDLKQQIDNQVKQDLQEQQQQGVDGQAASQSASVPDVTPSDDLPDALKPGHTLFRVVAPLSVKANGQDCALSPNDYLVRTSNLNGDGTVNVQVKASRTTDCQQGASTQIALNDLMVMEGDFQSQLRDGMQYASKDMGKNGMPKGPNPGATSVPLGTTVADANLPNTMQQQQREADEDESQARAAAVQGGTF
jgi:hypothetical protein